MVLDGAVLNQLYLQRDCAEKKKEAAREASAQKKKKGKATQLRKVSVHFEESEGSTIAEVSPDESGYEMEGWWSDLEALVEPDSSSESVNMVATSLHQAPLLPQTPVRLRHVSPITIGRSIGSPVRRVTRSRSARS